MNQPSNGEGLTPMAASGEERNWVGRWLQPTGSRAVVSSLVILALITMVCSLVYATGGTRFAWLHLMYLPIILAAACFGIYGGIAAALVAGFAIGPYMPMDMAQGLPQTTSSWMFRICFFLLVGAFSGFISNFLNGNIITVRIVNSTDAITAQATQVPYDKLMKISKRITEEIPSVVRCLYDITDKPPATIEFE